MFPLFISLLMKWFVFMSSVYIQQQQCTSAASPALPVPLHSSQFNDFNKTLYNRQKKHTSKRNPPKIRMRNTMDNGKRQQSHNNNNIDKASKQTKKKLTLINFGNCSHTCLCVHSYTCFEVCFCMFVCKFVWVSVSVCVCDSLSVQIHSCICIRVCMCACSRTHTYHTHTYTLTSLGVHSLGHVLTHNDTSLCRHVVRPAERTRLSTHTTLTSKRLVAKCTFSSSLCFVVFHFWFLSHNDTLPAMSGRRMRCRSCFKAVEITK